jgi:hypothetical protein
LLKEYLSNSVYNVGRNPYSKGKSNEVSHAQMEVKNIILDKEEKVIFVISGKEVGKEFLVFSQK